jgi:hypothetical protein
MIIIVLLIHTLLESLQHTLSLLSLSSLAISRLRLLAMEILLLSCVHYCLLATISQLSQLLAPDSDSEQSQSQSYVTTDGQSASLSWCQAFIWGLRPDFHCCQTFVGLLSKLKLLYDWRFTTNQFVLASSPLRLVIRIFFPPTKKLCYTQCSSYIALAQTT